MSSTTLTHLMGAILAMALFSGCSSAKRDCGDCSGFNGICTVGVCNQETWECEAQAANEGGTCDDHNDCTVDDVCNAGVCRGAAMDCTTLDGPCLEGVCQEGACVEQNRPNGTECPVDEACKIGRCQEGKCEASAKENGTPCNDADWCTEQDACQEGLCQGAARDCSDTLACTDDTCESSLNSCVHTPQSNWCVIDGACVADGTASLQNPCLVCSSVLDNQAWSFNDGASCDDGNRCTESDACLQGNCQGQPIAGCCLENADCADGIACTDDLCDLQGHTCSNPTTGGWCLISGLCVADGSLNPQNHCQWCDALADQLSWSNHDGISCDDGSSCTAPDLCQDGICRGAPIPNCCTLDEHCDDGRECTEDHCESSQKTCVYNILTGQSCNDGNECTAPDTCDSLGNCVGESIVTLPNAASQVAVTAGCLTYGTSATSVAWVALVDTSGLPITGATVTIEADEASVTWAGPVVESSARPGTYFRVLQAPAAALPGNDAELTVTARTGSGACQSPLVTLSTRPTVTFAPAASGSSGGCPIQHNLRVKVIAAESGAVLPNAYVMVGSVQGTVFEPDYENVLAGTATAQNTGRTAANGVVEFTDHGSALQGAQLVTAGIENRAYTSYIQVNASDLVIALDPITARPDMAQLDGTVTGLPISQRDGWVDASIVSTPFGVDSLVRFKFDDLMAQQADCWLACNVLGNPIWTALPVNIFIPSQIERYLIFDIDINQHNYKTLPLRVGAANQRIVAMGGRAPWSNLVNLMLNGGSLADIVPLLNMQRMGVIERGLISGDEHNVPIAASTVLGANTECRIESKPSTLSGSADLCLTIGDWSGGLGSGDLFIMGFKQLSGGVGTLTTVPNAAPFAGVGYFGMGVAAYLDADALPAAERWKARSTSGQLDRSGSLGPGGGSLRFASLLNITPLTENRPSFSWNSVSNGATVVHFTEHRLELVDTVTYDIGTECNPITEDIWRNTLWKVFAPGGVTSFTLPTLPAGWPRAAQGGLAVPTADQYLHWSFAAFHLAALAGSFDFNRFDLTTYLPLVTHTSTSRVDF